MGNFLKSVTALALLFLVMWATSCKKGSSPQNHNPIVNKSTLNSNATIHYTGPVAADGCSWLISLDADSTEYSPINLPENFKKDSLKVIVSYKHLNTRFHCGMLANSPGIPEVEIQSIQK